MNPSPHTSDASHAANAPEPSVPQNRGNTPQQGWAPKPHPLRNTLIFGSLILLGASLALYTWDLPPFGRDHESTDNAYVRGQTTVVSPQVSGYVTEVLVKDFVRVKAGQALVRIDDRIAIQRVAQARAQLAAQEAQLANSVQSQRSARAGIQAQDAALTNAQAQLARAQADLRRADALVQEGSISQRERDQTVAALRQAQAAVQQVQAQRSGAREQERAVVVGRDALQAAVEAAKAQLQLAEIDLTNTVIKAPADGQLGEVGVRLGQFVTAGTQLMSLVPHNVWVIANFKEAQSAQMQVGQTAELRVDALAGANLSGRVESLSPAAGSEFSVIKPDNATGNFVKVAQRISVRITIEPGQPLAERLRPGMSVRAKVDTFRNSTSGERP